MLLHEILAETARRFRTGEYAWAQHAMAYRKPTGEDEFGVDPVARLKPTEPNDPNAICFCALGGIVRTHGKVGSWTFTDDLATEYPTINRVLARACNEPLRDEDDTADQRYWPVVDFNDDDERTRDDVIAMLERAAALATPPSPED